MTTTIRCTHCGQTYELTPEQAPQYAGKTITCTACGQPFTVVMPGAVPPPLPPTVPPGYPPPYPQQTMPYATPQQRPQKTNVLAVMSLVFGILGLIVPVIGGLIAIVLGILGIGKTKDPQVGGKGLAIAGISVGAASIVVSGCFMSILLPSLNRARETANRVQCASNMRQVGLALLLYGNKHRGAYPPDLQTLLNTMPAEIDATRFVCRSSNDSPAAGTPHTLGAGSLSYVYVPGLTTSAPADAVLMYEPLTNHDNDGINVLFGDGHVEFLTRAQAQPIIAAVEAGQNPPPARSFR